jgi:hypothetical protein
MCLANIEYTDYGVGLTSDLTLECNLLVTKVGAAFTNDCCPIATSGIALTSAPACWVTVLTYGWEVFESIPSRDKRHCQTVVTPNELSEIFMVS